MSESDTARGRMQALARAGVEVAAGNPRFARAGSALAAGAPGGHGRPPSPWLLSGGEAVDRIEQGRPLREVAAAVGVHPRTVMRVLRSCGWVRGTRERSPQWSPWLPNELFHHVEDVARVRARLRAEGGAEWSKLPLMARQASLAAVTAIPFSMLAQGSTEGEAVWLVCDRVEEVLASGGSGVDVLERLPGEFGSRWPHQKRPVSVARDVDPDDLARALDAVGASEPRPEPQRPRPEPQRPRSKRPRRSTSWTSADEHRDEIVAAYRRGATLQEVCHEWGVSMGTLRRRLREWGVTVRPPGRPSSRGAPSPSIRPPRRAGPVELDAPVSPVHSEAEIAALRAAGKWSDL